MKGELIQCVTQEIFEFEHQFSGNIELIHLICSYCHCTEISYYQYSPSWHDTVASVILVKSLDIQWETEYKFLDYALCASLDYPTKCFCAGLRRRPISRARPAVRSSHRCSACPRITGKTSYRRVSKTKQALILCRIFLSVCYALPLNLLLSTLLCCYHLYW